MEIRKKVNETKEKTQLFDSRLPELQLFSLTVVQSLAHFFENMQGDNSWDTISDYLPHTPK